ncbi:MAG TPA: rhodanese-like domain-containing protein [Gemmatimonadaceae bacterium]
MILRRFYNDELAQASYLLGCESTRQAIVVDPNLDVAQYVDAAAAERLTIAYVTETHIHADFLSGARALTTATGAQLMLSGDGGPDWQYQVTPADGQTTVLLHDGDSISVGTVRLDVLHTPGHTPEHIAFLVTDTTVSDQPVGLISGDFIFVGDVGRPDLLERAAHVAGTMEASAKQLFASLRRVAALPDYLQLWPGHGAGSACGKALGALPQSTLGYERLVNSALRERDESAFVRDILSAQPEPPRYFARMKRLNRDGVSAGAAWSAEAARLAPDDVERALATGALVVDARPSAEFRRAFVPGSVCVPKSKSFTTYFGAIAPEHAPVVLLVARDGDVAPLSRALRLIGFDEIVGWAPASAIIEARRGRGAAIESLAAVDVPSVQARLAEANPPLVLDVRGAGERQYGVIAGSVGVALNNVRDWAGRGDTAHDAPIVVHCHTGTRAVIGASLLVAQGFSDVTPMTGGFDAWLAAGLPVQTPSPN